MKLVIQMFTLLMLIGLTSTVWALEDEGITIKNAGEKAFVLSLDTEKPYEVTIRLKDLSGTVLLNEEKMTAQLSKRYDLKQLPEGAYVLQVEYGQKLFSQEIIVKSGQLQIDGSEAEEFYKPVINVKGRYVNVFIPFAYQSKANMVIYDADGSSYYRGAGKGAVNIKKRFDLSEFPEGTYWIEIRYKGQNFVKEIEI